MLELFANTITERGTMEKEEFVHNGITMRWGPSPWKTDKDGQRYLPAVYDPLFRVYYAYSKKRSRGKLPWDPMQYYPVELLCYVGHDKFVLERVECDLVDEEICDRNREEAFRQLRASAEERWYDYATRLKRVYLETMMGELEALPKYRRRFDDYDRCVYYGYETHPSNHAMSDERLRAVARTNARKKIEWRTMQFNWMCED